MAFRNSICIASSAMALPMQFNMDSHAQLKLQCNSARIASHAKEVPVGFIPLKRNAHANASQYISPLLICNANANALNRFICYNFLLSQYAVVLLILLFTILIFDDFIILLF